MTISPDVERLRADTPGCAHGAHLDNAGSALPPRPVTETVIEHLRLEERIGGYAAAAAAEERTESVYDAVAALVGGAREEVALCESATRAWDMAFYSLPLRAGDRVLTGNAEYASNVIALLQVARRTGAVVEVVPDDEHGAMSVDALRTTMDERVRLVAVSHVPSQSGLVQPAAEIGAVCRESGVVYLIDACQSAGQLPLDVAELGCDLLTATGRKWLRGPRGTGFLWARRELLTTLEPPFLDVHSASWTSPTTYDVRADARRFESWEADHAARLGLGAAVEYALALGVPVLSERIRALAEALRSRLAEVGGARLHDPGKRRCGIVTFTVDGRSADEVKRACAATGITVSVSAAASSRTDLAARGVGDVVRASPHCYNTENEVGRLVEVVRGLR